jgi:hypothetical protein
MIYSRKTTERRAGSGAIEVVESSLVEKYKKNEGSQTDVGEENVLSSLLLVLRETGRSTAAMG